MNGEFNIEMADYTPPATYEIEPSVPSFDYPPETRYVSDYYTNQAVSSALNDNNSSASGWLNSVANLLPSVSNMVSSYLGYRKADSTPLPATYAEAPRETLNGVLGQTRLFGTPSGAEQKTKSNNLLLFIIGGAVLFFFLFMRK